MVITERTPEAKAKSPILYKPSFEAIEVVIFIANFDPEKNCKIGCFAKLGRSPFLLLFLFKPLPILLLQTFGRLCDGDFFFLQIFFDDSARNIASGKVAGRHTVIVRALQLKKNN